MAAKLKIDLHPKDALTGDTQSEQRLFARFIYTRVVPDQPADSPLRVPASTNVELDVEGKAAFIIDDGAPESEATLQIATAQGAVLATHAGKFPADGETDTFVFAFPVAMYRQMGERAKPAVGAMMNRVGRFTRFDDTLPDFGRHRFYVAPIRPEKSSASDDNPQTQAVRSLLDLQGRGDVTEFEVKELDPTSASAASANALGLRTCTVRSDGAFDFSLPVVGDEIGWAWVLLGPTSYVGYQVDHESATASKEATIILPPPSAGGRGSGDNSRSLSDEATEGSGRPPLDFDERQIVDNPRDFGDDPGLDCSPFTNPQRILGERPFFTVLRVDQPEIGGEGSLAISRPVILDLAPPLRVSALTSAFPGVAEPQVEPGLLIGGITTGDSLLTRSFRMAASVEATAPPGIEARELLKTKLGKSISESWRKWVLERTPQRYPVSPRNPIEWEGNPTIYQAGSVAGGHILEHRVQWRSNGYSLGNVAHTLSLAPRQVRRISKVSWRRREAATRREITTSRDRVSQTTLRDRDYADAVLSSLAEWSSGGSRSSTTGASGGIGFALGPIVIGGGASHGQASSSSWQEGGRRVTAAEQQSLRDAIRQFADSTRQLESTVVTELTQEEEVEGVSETVRNINYCHALTVIYHEILRHYRVDTSFAGVRECLFVPFSISPFDVTKALKWRDKLREGMLARHLRWALDHLDEIANAWVDSDIPAGPRSRHPITYVTGSAYIKLSIERPRDRAEEEAIEEYRELWNNIAPLLGVSAGSTIERLERLNRDRDVYFQREIAPTVAANWVDRLKCSVGNTPIGSTDFTLASSYRFGTTVRVDFTIPADRRFNRENLQAITFRSNDPLPAGSVANLASVRLRYFTDQFDAAAESVQTTDDLINPASGAADIAGAVTRFPITIWERQDLRRVIEDAVDELIVHLNANMVYYHKVIWWLMDRDELFMLLDGFAAPYGRRFENGKWVDDRGRSLASIVEREPLGILGNALVFRVSGGVFLGIDGHDSPKALHNYYYDSEYRSQPLRVSLPTEGLYAQALMDQCDACEEHFGSTDWVLSNGEPELEGLANQLASRRTEPADIRPSQIPETLINLQNAPNAPEPTGLAGILQAVTNATAFRDMAGLTGTQTNAAEALTQAASLATSFGQMAVDFQKAKQGTADAKQKLSNIKKAKVEGLIDDTEAARQSAATLSEQNMSTGTKPLTDAPPITNALNAAGITGRPLEVTRQGLMGTETVKVGSHPGGADVVPASFIPGRWGRKTATQLPSRIGNAAPQAWEKLKPIAPRNPANCSVGLKNLGTILFVHDAETEIDLRDYASYSNADWWMLVHTVSDLIEGLRAVIGICGYVTGIHIEAHGGTRIQRPDGAFTDLGGFRMGDDKDHDGRIEQGDAQDRVSTAAQAEKFGKIIKNAFGPSETSFMSVAACSSSGDNDAFIKALHKATGTIAIGSVAECRSGGNWFFGDWWEAHKGRTQVNKDGTIKVDTSDEGTGIWKPF